MDGEAERAREAVHVGVDVESLELEPNVACGGEERADVTADLESGAAPAERAEQAAGLDSIGGALRPVQPVEQLARRRRVGVDGIELVCPLDRIAVHETAPRALDETERWMLGERDAIHEPLGRRRGTEPPAVKGPQQLHLALHRFGVGDLYAVLAPAGDALRDLVGWGLRLHSADKVQDMGRSVLTWKD